MSLFFLMCSERSGSNFISKLLNGHSNICGPSTKHIVNPVARNLFRYGDLSVEENWHALLTDIHRLISVDFSVWKKQFDFNEINELAVVGDITSLIQNIFLEEAKANGKQHVFIKENQVYEFLPFLMTFFPESKFVYQTRDPRDMALSWKKNSSHPGGIVKAAKQWKADQQQSLKNYHLLKSKDLAHFVKYEDLTANSEAEIKKILNFLGVKFEPSIFEFHQDEITQKNAGMQAAWNNLSQGVIKNNSKKYLNELSKAEVKAIESICFYEMNFLGYETEYSEEELMAVSNEYIDELLRSELIEKKYDRAEGVKANMAAKAVFYRR